ncbi:cupin domain-containing protein [Streptomyces sp. NBC_00582]|uniref:cupin domain-containing protein n=1 Tax=Streptomyces sp. NBC_00582 TaxID=2975783 RepID=UPI001062BA55|nr:cupin domain-containing protein [Streptomyces sp. NBC_00582]WUB66071.1 cupin domain-containing protein [Streptomyces sp. NBC_00582]
MSAPEIRRVVTGHDREGKAVVVSDEVRGGSGPGSFAALLWTTDTSPADNTQEADGAERKVGITQEGGTVFRIAEFAPGLRSPMHRTLSVDYALVLDGELVLELDGGERTPLKAGDVVIQRGTNHVWANESDKPCTIAFILIDAEPVTINGEVLEPTPLELPIRSNV